MSMVNGIQILILKKKPFYSFTLKVIRRSINFFRIMLRGDVNSEDGVKVIISDSFSFVVNVPNNSI